MRLIDADELKTAFPCGESVRTECVRATIDNMATIMPTAEPHWIPVSERLPEDEGWYLVTDDSGGVLWLEVEHYDPEVGLEPFCTVQNPVAWMPLPEPYKAGENE